MREVSRGGRFLPRRPLRLGRGAPRILATRGITETEVRTLLLVSAYEPNEEHQICDEYWFDDSVGFALMQLLQRHAPAPGQVRTVSWVEADAA